jgi:chloramphenicol 3-O-phosphotransferase
MNGQIIVVSGPQGAGKSTTCRNFARRSPKPYLMFGVDLLLGSMMPAKFSMHAKASKEGVTVVPVDGRDPDGPIKMACGEFAWGALRAMHEMIATASRRGLNVVADHIMFLDPPVLQDCIWALEGLPVLFVGLNPDRGAIIERVLKREIKVPPDFAESIGEDAAAKVASNAQRLMPWFIGAVGRNDCFDLVIDSVRHSPDEVCEQIETRLERGPGTAFETLRGRYPRSS